jgi:hypothetical protein
MALLLPVAAAGEPKKPDPKDQPRVTLVLPLGAAPGKTTRLTVRGLKLDTATEVRLPGSKATAKIVGKGKAPVPDKEDLTRVGDTQVEVELTLPPDTPTGTVSLVAVTPAGETPSHTLLVEGSIPVIAEKEPNNGFLQAQPLPLPGAVDGAVGQPQDVDVYRFEGRAGQAVVCEVFAARHGSALDPVLTLYDASGRQLAVCDDLPDSTDARIEATLPRDGAYFLSVIDAHDTGGPLHVYRLTVRPR